MITKTSLLKISLIPVSKGNLTLSHVLDAFIMLETISPFRICP